MNYKRIINVLLSLAFALSLLSGCGGETAPVAATPEELVAALDISEIQKQELLYMAELGFPLNPIRQETISGKEIMKLLDKLVEYAAPEKLEEWKTLYPAFRSVGKDLTRIDVLSALFLAVRHIGGDYGYYRVNHNNPMFHAMLADVDPPNFDLFGGAIEFDLEGWGTDHHGTGGCIYNVTRKSPMDGEYPMAYDEETDSFRMSTPCTYADALLAIVRAIRLGESPSIVPVNDPAAVTPNPHILTLELLEKAAENPVVTAQDHPRWTGFVLNYTAAAGEINTSPREIELSSEWGFNAARLFLHYDTVFSKDTTTVDISTLEKVDELVAAAIEHGLHLDIMLSSLPGRNVREASAENDYISTAELDLFINEEQQAMADRIFQILAKRYKDVPNFNLSFAPFYEAQNKNMSTGLPSPDYTAEDVANYLGRVMDVIRTEDPNRLIVYEATPSNHWDAIIPESAPAKEIADEKGNAIISYNFCENPYVYACMTATEGYHIDNMNSSMYIPEYPNYIYSVASSVWVGAPITLNGLLPAGTTLDLYLERSGRGGTLDISADGVSLYSENLQDAEYEIGERLSGYYPFATSEKQISITLTEDADEITISCLRDGGFDISGIYLTLPEEYAVDRWYYAQAYDVYMNLEEEEGVVKKRDPGVMLAPNDHDSGRYITIHDDLSYTSEHVYEEASAETISAWSDAIGDFDGNCVIRFERADFSGATWESMSAYYEDLLKSFEEYDFSWFSNDWWLLTDEYPQTRVIAECPSTEYAGYKHFNLELLQLLQKYQSKE